MKKRITDFTEIKAYTDIFNERGHPGFKEPVNPFLWWNHTLPGKVDDAVHAFIDDGLVVVLELENASTVKNMLVFSLCRQKRVLKMILDIVRDYDTVIYNSEFRDRYRNITKKLDGAFWLSNERHCYSADGGKAWSRLFGRQ